MGILTGVKYLSGEWGSDDMFDMIELKRVFIKIFLTIEVNAVE